ncbi:hypothetical protein COLO4_06445 [Corchorus olitorius]|uniref:Uncharacterized protein n=1 Tax=Corchorus olitorius TaxID=93759 RepID=A0A1R3KMZ7_9ROSI|nr:hypothetical protein COLO4_06445 [Corchorus olitorius]
MATPISIDSTCRTAAWHVKIFSPSPTSLEPAMENPNTTAPHHISTSINSENLSSSSTNTTHLSTSLSSTTITYHESFSSEQPQQPCSIHTGPEPHSGDGRPCGPRRERPSEPTPKIPPQARTLNPHQLIPMNVPPPPCPPAISLLTLLNFLLVLNQRSP